MSTEPKTPEFGYNGAVLNSDMMTESLKQDYARAADKSRAKGGWARMLLAIWLTIVASDVFGFETVFPVLICILVAMLLYQRFIKRRSWDSILYGIHSPKD